MDIHADGFYELEFQRLYRQQGRVLRRIRHLEKQLLCYYNLQADGVSSLSLKERINLTIDRLGQEYILRDSIEAEKEAVSLNNPANSARAVEAKIISDAYDCAYAPTKPVSHGILNAVCKHFAGRDK